jgi:hypothetical protein
MGLIHGARQVGAWADSGRVDLLGANQCCVDLRGVDPRGWAHATGIIYSYLDRREVRRNLPVGSHLLLPRDRARKRAPTRNLDFSIFRVRLRCDARARLRGRFFLAPLANTGS